MKNARPKTWNLRSQVDVLKREKAKLQRQHQAIEASLRAELEQASRMAKLVPLNRDSQVGKVEKLTTELTSAYNQQKRFKAQYKD